MSRSAYGIRPMRVRKCRSRSAVVRTVTKPREEPQ